LPAGRIAPNLEKGKEEPVRKLQRSRSDRVLFGVCGGLGEYLGLDPNLVRILWIASLLAGGAGVIPYIAAIFLLPEADAPAVESTGPGGARILGFVLIALAGILFLRTFGVEWISTRVFAFWTLGVLVPLVLLVAGVFLVWPRARDAVGFTERRKPRRSVSDRILAGVAGGIAAELNVDSNLIRLAFVLVGVVTSGFALVIYLLLVLVLPEEEIPAPAAASPPPPPPPSAAPTPEEPPEEAPRDQDPPGEGR